MSLDVALDLAIFAVGLSIAVGSVALWLIGGPDLTVYEVVVAGLAIFMSRHPLTLLQRAGDIEVGFEAALLVFLALTGPPLQALALWSLAMLATHLSQRRRWRARIFNIGTTVVGGALLVWICALGRSAGVTGVRELVMVVVACSVYFCFDLVATAISIAVEEHEPLASTLRWRSVLLALSCFVGVDTLGYLGALLLRTHSAWTLLLLLMPVGAILVAGLSVSRSRLAEQRLSGLFDAATQAPDWADEAEFERALVAQAEVILRRSIVELRPQPAGPGEIGAVLAVDGRGPRHLVARRTVNVNRFNDDDQRALEALAAVGAASMNRRRQTDETAYLARHDILTGLVNRGVFSDRLEHALQLRRRTGEVAVLYCDLDGFKSINDRLGHEAGDRLLVAVAQRLSSCLRTSDTAARIGGDEFAILVEALPDPSGPRQLADRILAACEPTFCVDGRDVHMALSIGIAYAKGDGSGEDLLHQADTAMYRAKAHGKGRAEVFEPIMQSEILQRIELEEELRKAVRSHVIELEYQPVVALVTGRIEGFEALARWYHPTLGPVPPAVFIPMAERMGLIDQLGQQVLALGHAAGVAMRDIGGRPFTMGVNVSPAQVKDPALLQQVNELIASAPDIQLVLELTESALLADDAETSSALVALEEAGAALAVDDFGVGYSSIGYLYRLPVKIVKLDRSLIQALGEPRALTLVQGVVAMAQAMGMTVIAEGIEDWATAIAVRRLGCPLGQGYVLARPMPLDQALAASSAGFLHTSMLQAGIPDRGSSRLADSATAGPNLDR
ncbi:MAG: EAL domain-containing protein [Actinomycetota bacterium]|nr:EAL domain-containing protein [Actinomycetota bacterium]